MKTVWWDGYDGQEVAIIEDIDKYDVKFGGHMKEWADRYAFRGNQKFGGTLLRPKKLVVTSNYSIREIWSDIQTYGPLERRFKSIYIGPVRDEVQGHTVQVNQHVAGYEFDLQIV